MICRLYEDSDYEEVSTWYLERDLNPVAQQDLPTVGYIVPGIACSYLIQTDSKMAFLDGFISNPRVTREERVEAMKKIDVELLKAAAEFGYEKVFVFTKHPTIVHECQNVQEYTDLGSYRAFYKEVSR